MILSKQMLEFCRDHETNDLHNLALQANKYPNIDIKLALTQIKGLQIAKVKIPSWYNNHDIIYPSSLSLEQSSSEKTAIYKASIIDKSKTFIDLTGGMGVDTSFLSAKFESSIYIEKNESLAHLTKHNFKALGLNIDCKTTDAITYLETTEKVNFIYIDPARRSKSGQKAVFIEDCSPNLLSIQELLDNKSEKVIIKLSPMLDISLALKFLTNISQLHIVSVNNECKELLFIKNNHKHLTEPTIHCVNILKYQTDEFIYLRSNEDSLNIVLSGNINKDDYLYEPNASIMKAGAYKSIQKHFGLKKLHPSSHLYTSNQLTKGFLGRTFQIKEIFSMKRSDLKALSSKVDKANILVRNFPLAPKELQKLLKIKDGGDNYIIGTTESQNKKIILLCTRIF